MHKGNKTDAEVAEEGLARMEEWMEKIGVRVSLRDLGATEDMIEGMADATIMLKGGYKVLDRDEVVEILKESM